MVKLITIERELIEHALLHLEDNTIAKDKHFFSGGWYIGNKEQFIERHLKTIELMKELLERTRHKD